MGSQPQSNLFLLETFDLISNNTVFGVLYGITFTLYCFCARLSYLQFQELDKWWQARFTLAYTSLIIFCTTAHLALNTQLCQLAYVNHGNFPGGPLEYEGSKNSSIAVYETAVGIVGLIIEVLTMAIQIWRLWIVWSGTRYAAVVVILPFLLLFAFIGLYLQVFINIIPGFLPLEQLGISRERFHAKTAAAYAVLSTFTVLVTGLVTARLFLVRRRYVRIMGRYLDYQVCNDGPQYSAGTPDTSSPYMSIIAMLTESYALDSIWSVGVTISAGTVSPSLSLFIDNDVTVKVIAYFLVVYRVAAGRGWTEETGRKLTSLQWDHGVHTVTDTDEASGVRSRVPATTTMRTTGSAPLYHSESVV